MSLDASIAKAVKWGEGGLVVAVAQDRLTGRVQMVAWMNEEALAETIRTRKATFFSRSRQRLWTKGETSGNELHVDSMGLDCDGDAILLGVHPRGPSCHTGSATCFFTRIDRGAPEGTEPMSPMLVELEEEIARRKTADASTSYTKSLLEKGVSVIGDKLREEADELGRAIASESEERVAAEAADVVYHLLVALAARDVPLRRVLETLASRRGTSGVEEKRSRAPK